MLTTDSTKKNSKKLNNFVPTTVKTGKSTLQSGLLLIMNSTEGQYDATIFNKEESYDSQQLHSYKSMELVKLHFKVVSPQY